LFFCSGMCIVIKIVTQVKCPKFRNRPVFTNWGGGGRERECVCVCVRGGGVGIYSLSIHKKKSDEKVGVNVIYRKIQ
jgi:hypothetical protein